VKAIWQVANWANIADRFQKATKGMFPYGRKGLH
jgi:hypothetical protein